MRARFPSSHSKRKFRLKVNGQQRPDDTPTTPLDARQRERVPPAKGRRG